MKLKFNHLDVRLINLLKRRAKVDIYSINQLQLKHETRGLLLMNRFEFSNIVNLHSFTNPEVGTVHDKARKQTSTKIIITSEQDYTEKIAVLNKNLDCDKVEEAILNLMELLAYHKLNKLSFNQKQLEPILHRLLSLQGRGPLSYKSNIIELLVQTGVFDPNLSNATDITTMVTYISNWNSNQLFIKWCDYDTNLVKLLIPFMLILPKFKVESRIDELINCTDLINLSDVYSSVAEACYKVNFKLNYFEYGSIMVNKLLSQATEHRIRYLKVKVISEYIYKHAINSLDTGVGTNTRSTEDLNKGLELFRRVKNLKFNFKFPKKLYTKLLYSISKHSNHIDMSEALIEVFDRATFDNYELKVIIYNQVLEAYAKLAANHIHQLPNSNSKSNDVNADMDRTNESSYVQIYGIHYLHQMSKVYRRLRNHNLKPDPYTLSSFLKIYTLYAFQNPSWALHTLEQRVQAFDQLGVQLNLICYTRLIQFYTTINRLDLVQQTVDRATNAKIVFDAKFKSMLTNTLSKSKQYALAEELIKKIDKFQTQLHPTAPANEDLITLCHSINLASKKFDLATMDSIWHRITNDFSLELNLKHYAVILNAYHHTLNFYPSPDNRLDLDSTLFRIETIYNHCLRKLELTGVPRPDIFLTNLMLKVYASYTSLNLADSQRVELGMDKLTDFYNSTIDRLHIVPNSLTYVTMFNCFTDLNISVRNPNLLQKSEAYIDTYLKHLYDDDITFTAPLYLSLIKVLWSCNKSKQIDSVYNDFVTDANISFTQGEDRVANNKVYLKYLQVKIKLNSQFNFVPMLLTIKSKGGLDTEMCKKLTKLLIQDERVVPANQTGIKKRLMKVLKLVKVVSRDEGDRRMTDKLIAIFEIVHSHFNNLDYLNALLKETNELTSLEAMDTIWKKVDDKFKVL